MSEIEVKKVTNRAGTGSPNFPYGVKSGGSAVDILAPTRTEGETQPETPSEGDTFYDTANDTYDVYIGADWRRILGEPVGPVNWTVDLSNVTYDSVSFSVASQDTSPLGVAFSADGTKMYVAGNSNNTIYQYSLSTGFDVSTASYDSVGFAIGSQDGTPYNILFNTNGTKMYMLGNSSDTIYQYSLSTGFDVSTASYDSVSFSVASQDGNPTGIAFNTDGTKMYIVGDSGNSIYQYSLSTGFDVSTASYDSVSFSFSSQDTYPIDVVFNTDGTKMYMLGNSSRIIYQYSLSTGFDVSTASYDSVSFSVASQDGTNPRGVAFSADGTKIYMVGNTSDTIYQYSTGL